jgi:hypothetical protein
MQAKINQMNRQNHNDFIEGSSQRSTYFGCFESFLIVGLAAFQVYYLMQLLEKRVLL